MKLKQLTYIIVVFIVAMLPTTAMAQEERKAALLDGIEYGVEMQGSMAFGNGKTPLWLNANKYGLSSLEKENGYLRASLERPLVIDEEYKWGIGYGVDMAAAYNYTSKAIVQQAYVEGRWLKGVLTIGIKQQPMELKNQELSSGSQTLGINARPVPQVRVALPEYWDIPGTDGWLSLKGHIAYGMTTDDKWQKDFTRQQTRYTENTLYHSKAGYLKIGNEYRFMPVSLEMGLEMAALFGGTSYNVNEYGVVKNEGGLKGIWHAFIPGGAEAVEDVYKNVGGDQLGSWVMRLNFDYDDWYLGVYWDHFFEDHSAMFHISNNGYGTGEEWNSRKGSKFVLYDLKDMMIGTELRLKNADWLNCIVLEYLYTKYQSGPIYHDHTPNIADHIGGVDEYYNHYIFTGWQHWGQVIGNPLYLSPIYNNDGTIEIKNNRFYAFHLGVSGDPSDNLHYRVLATYQKGFGRYSVPYTNPRECVSVLAEAHYEFPKTTGLGGWSVTTAAGMDTGKLRGTNQGIQLTIAKKWK